MSTKSKRLERKRKRNAILRASLSSSPNPSSPSSPSTSSSSSSSSASTLRSVFGADAHATVELKFDVLKAKNKSPRIQAYQLQHLVLWVLHETVAPQWVYVHLKTVVEKVLVVAVDGLNQHEHAKVRDCLPQVHARLAAGESLPAPMYVHSSAFAPASMYRSLLHFDSAREKLIFGFTKPKPKRRKVKRIKAPEEGDDKGEAKDAAGEGAEKDAKDKLPGRDFYVCTTDQLELYGFPMNLPANGAVDKSMGEVAAAAAAAAATAPNGQAGAAAEEEPMVALDCEMVVTDRGYELARLTLVNEDGSTLYDEVVLPRGEVRDYVTRYSGITKEMLDKATKTFEEAQADFRRLVPPTRILVGHSLENDLKSIEMMHPRIIDTTILFPHVKGPPLKSSLRYLSKKFLKREIQGSADGHCSAEDALAALDLVKLKMKMGPDYGSSPSTTALTSVLANVRRTSTLITRPDVAAAIEQPAASVVTVSSDAEAVEKGLAFAKATEKADFALVQLHDVYDALEAAHAKGDDSDSDSDSEDSSDEEDDDDADETMKDATPKEATSVKEAVAQLDQRVASLFDACPPNTLVMLVSGASWPGKVRALASRRSAAERASDTANGVEEQAEQAAKLFNEEDKMELSRAQQALKEGVFFLGMKN